MILASLPDGVETQCFFYVRACSQTVRVDARLMRFCKSVHCLLRGWLGEKLAERLCGRLLDDLCGAL